MSSIPWPVLMLAIDYLIPVISLQEQWNGIARKYTEDATVAKEKFDDKKVEHVNALQQQLDLTWPTDPFRIKYFSEQPEPREFIQRRFTSISDISSRVTSIISLSQSCALYRERLCGANLRVLWQVSLGLTRLCNVVLRMSHEQYKEGSYQRRPEILPIILQPHARLQTLQAVRQSHVHEVLLRWNENCTVYLAGNIKFNVAMQPLVEDVEVNRDSWVNDRQIAQLLLQRIRHVLKDVRPQSDRMKEAILSLLQTQLLRCPSLLPVVKPSLGTCLLDSLVEIENQFSLRVARLLCSSDVLCEQNHALAKHLVEVTTDREFLFKLFRSNFEMMQIVFDLQARSVQLLGCQQEVGALGAETLAVLSESFFLQKFGKQLAPKDFVPVATTIYNHFRSNYSCNPLEQKTLRDGDSVLSSFVVSACAMQREVAVADLQQLISNFLGFLVARKYDLADEATPGQPNPLHLAAHAPNLFLLEELVKRLGSSAYPLLVASNQAGNVKNQTPINLLLKSTSRFHHSKRVQGWQQLAVLVPQLLRSVQQYLGSNFGTWFADAQVLLDYEAAKKSFDMDQVSFKERSFFATFDSVMRSFG